MPGAPQGRYAARRVAVMESGHSALNTILDLVELRVGARTEVTSGG